METTLVQKFLNELKCHSCSCQMEPPLIQCSEGHFYCNKCIEISSTCSECNSPVGTNRNYILERVTFNKSFKCSFSEGGCSVTGTATVVAEHENRCSFSSFRSAQTEDLDDSNGKCDSEVRNDSDVAEKSLDDVFLEELECPVCTRYISPPIGGCDNGHIICKECLNRVKRCPICRTEKSPATNVVLERIHYMMEVPCDYASNGCDFRGRGSLVPDHQELCVYAPKSCPLKCFQRCKWKGMQSEIVNHCRIAHGHKLYLEAEHKFVLVNFLSNHKRRSSVNLFYVYGVLFRCGWYKLGGDVRFSVQYIGKKEIAGIYFYEMSILFPGSNDVGTTTTNECTHFKEDSNKFVGSRFIMMPPEYLLQFCVKDSNNNLTYVVRIFVNNGIDM